MLDGAARPKGATRRCAAGPRPAPASNRQQPGARPEVTSQPRTAPRLQAIGRGPLIRLTPAGSTDKQGSVWLRWVLCEAAQTAKRSPQFAAGYQAIATRRGKKIATTAVARKLLTRAWHLLTDAEHAAATQPAAASAPQAGTR